MEGRPCVIDPRQPFDHANPEFAIDLRVSGHGICVVCVSTRIDRDQTWSGAFDRFFDLLVHASR